MHGIVISGLSTREVGRYFLFSQKNVIVFELIECTVIDDCFSHLGIVIIDN